jgi:phosphatidate phosphatase APP1
MKRHQTHKCPVHGIERCFGQLHKHGASEIHYCSQGAVGVKWRELGLATRRKRKGDAE